MLVPAIGDLVALGVVPVGFPAGEGDGCPALWTVHGVPLVRRAVAGLAPHVEAVVAPAAPGLVAQVAAALESLEVARVVPAPESRPGPLALIRAAVRAVPVAQFGAVIIHDPLQLALQASLVPAVLQALAGPGAAPAAAVAGRITDTLSWVGTDEVIVGASDRDRFQEVRGPQAYRTAALLRALEAMAAMTQSPADGSLGRLASGAGACWLPRTGDVLVVETADDLALAEALLDADR